MSNFVSLVDIMKLKKRFPSFYLSSIVTLPGSNTARVAEYDAPDTTPAPPTEKLESMRNISS